MAGPVCERLDNGSCGWRIVDCPEPSGYACGAYSSYACGPDEYCNYPLGNCGAGDTLGTCETKPMVCPRESNPTCGCDGNTYSNPCGAASAGVSVAHRGAC